MCGVQFPVSLALAALKWIASIASQVLARASIQYPQKILSANNVFIVKRLQHVFASFKWSTGRATRPST